MAKLSLNDVVNLMENEENTMNVVENPDMQNYVEEMQTVGEEVIDKLSNNELAAIVSFMQAMFCARLIQEQPILALNCMQSSDEVGVSMVQALKVAIGVILSEEWR